MRWNGYIEIKGRRLHYDDGAPYPFRCSPNTGGKVQHVFLGRLFPRRISGGAW
jgi:hypothetical protein